MLGQVVPSLAVQVRAVEHRGCGKDVGDAVGKGAKRVEHRKDRRLEHADTYLWGDLAPW